MQASTPLCRTAARIASKSCYTFNCGDFFTLASQRPLLYAVNSRSARRQSSQRTPSQSNAQHGKRFRTANSSQFTDIVFPDPNRPDLYYHFVNPPTPLSLTLPTFALSFLHESPPSVDSATVIGWLLAQTHKANVSEASTESSEPLKSDASLQDFRGNPKFVSFLHKVVQSGLTQGIDDIWKDTALQLQAGWMHIHDQRNPPDQGRIGDSDDIIGTVLVDNGKIRPETYQPMPSYRVCTSDGVLQLTPGLAEHLRHALERLIV